MLPQRKFFMITRRYLCALYEVEIFYETERIERKG